MAMKSHTSPHKDSAPKIGDPKERRSSGAEPRSEKAKVKKVTDSSETCPSCGRKM